MAFGILNPFSWKVNRMSSEKRYLIHCPTSPRKAVKFSRLLNPVISFASAVGRREILGSCGSIDAHVFSIYHHTLRSYLQVFLLHVLTMADAMQAFNNVPPPPGPPVDANSAFADALKRAKEVVMLLRSFKGVFMHVFITNFPLRLRHVWDRVALL